MKNYLKKILVSIAVFTLISCGSNQADAVRAPLSTGISPTTASANFGKAASDEEIKAMSAKLGSYFNGQYASNPKALMGAQATADKASGLSEPLKIAASNVASPVYRFFNTKTGAHFFTMSAVERDYVGDTFPFFNFEGNSFLAYPEADPTLSPVYRFYNNVTGTHFFTINAEEKAYVQATWPAIFTYEGISWYASTSESTSWVPVYRFFNTKTGTHFYTTSAVERDHVLATWNWFNFEGIAYYVKPAPEPTCTPAAIGSTGYSLVFKGCNVADVATYYDKTECVRDNATGLIWQGQTAAGTGLRANDQNKTNYDSTSSRQKWNGTWTTNASGNSYLTANNFTTPTVSDINAITNSIGFKNAVNASNLCGSSSWRLPTNLELSKLVKTNEYPMIDNMWFPNTVDWPYWTSDTYTADALCPDCARIVDFYNGRATYEFRDYPFGYYVGGNGVRVRLVR
jgi:Protein of unknown function (DUF1566)/Repeat of unknown function (DUF5648)